MRAQKHKIPGKYKQIGVCSGTDTKVTRVHGPSTIQYRFLWLSWPRGVICNFSWLLGSSGSGSAEVASFFLCLLCTTPHARSIEFFISVEWHSCSSTNWRRILSLKTYMSISPCTLKRRGQAHLEIPVSSEKATLQSFKWINIRVQVVVPEDRSFRRFKVFRKHDSYSRRDLIFAEPAVNLSIIQGTHEACQDMRLPQVTRLRL